MEKIFVSEHDLSTFFVKFVYNDEEYSTFKKELERVLEILDFFEGEWSRTRYPKEKGGKVLTPTEMYALGEATEAIEKAKEVLKIIKEILAKRFNFKF